MNEHDLIQTIYQYYPRGLKNEDGEKVTDSQEYNKRAELCHDVAHSQADFWRGVKAELQSFLFARDAACSDLSALGTVPCYYLQIAYNRRPTGIGYTHLLYVMISLIAPYWAFRFQSREENGGYRYKVNTELESAMVEYVKTLIAEYFPLYTQLPEEWRSKVIPDIDTPFSHGKPVSIFNAIFVDD